MNKNNRWRGGTDEEYSTQHFGFGSQRLKIALREMIEEKIRTGVTDMESYLVNGLDLNETDQAMLRTSCEKLLKLYGEKAESSFQVVDSEIERLLNVPTNVLLPEDEVHEEELTEEEYNKLKQEVSDMRNRVERAALVEALLTAEDKEIARMEKVCETAKRHMGVQDMIHKNVDQSDMKTIQNGAQFLCAQCPVKDPDFLDDA